jgi:hypothetical protein
MTTLREWKKPGEMGTGLSHGNLKHKGEIGDRGGDYRPLNGANSLGVSQMI